MGAMLAISQPTAQSPMASGSDACCVWVDVVVAGEESQSQQGIEEQGGRAGGPIPFKLTRRLANVFLITATELGNLLRRHSAYR